MPIGTGLPRAVLAAVALASAVAAPSQPAARPSDAGRWGWPLAPAPEVVRRFDRPDQPWLPGHRGVDLAAAVGQSVRAPSAGVVSWTGAVAGRGVVVVAHPSGTRTTFEPVAGAPTVGTPVRRGDSVGTLTGTSGHCAPRVCLHWGVLRGETYLDPLSYLGRPRIVLLPLP